VTAAEGRVLEGTRAMTANGLLVLLLLAVLPITGAPGAQSTSGAAPATGPSEAATSVAVEVARDLTYVATPPVTAGDTTLDLYYTASTPGATPADPSPIVVFVHGGGWRRGDKSQHAEKGEYFARAGFLFASINYRLHPDVDPAAQALDVAQAVSWIARNAETYDADPTRVFLIGHSAGAHLAALAALDPTYLERARFPRQHLRGVVLLDGAGYDLLERQGSELELELDLLRTVFGDDPATLRRLSPIHAIDSSAGGTPPPFLVLHVPRETSRQASVKLGARLRQAGGTAEVVETPGKTHRTLNRELGHDGDGPTMLVSTFLRRLSTSPSQP
jgi:arylformamidase